jgi:hypothetical protein
MVVCGETVVGSRKRETTQAAASATNLLSAISVAPVQTGHFEHFSARDAA